MLEAFDLAAERGFIDETLHKLNFKVRDLF